MKKQVLIISPHPDDDVIGMGGEIAHISKDHLITIIYVTNGVGSLRLGKYSKLTDKEFINVRKKEAIESIEEIRKSNIKQIFLNLNSSEILKDHIIYEDKLKKIINKIRPDKTYIPYIKDKHITHKVISKISLKVIKTNIFYYETWTPIIETKGLILRDITKLKDVKKRAIKKHKSQCLIKRFDEGILAKNRYNAVFSEINSQDKAKYLEIFLKA